MAAARFIGLTGAIASGKSEALAALARLGAATLSSDRVVHDLLGEERVRELLVGRWGPDVAPDGEIDRARVAAIVFERPEELDWLEATLHPLVAEEISDWRAALPADTKIAVVEVPLLFETDLDGVFDATVSVVADDEVRAERAGARGTLDLESRAQRQLSQKEKAARATYVVANDGSLKDLETALAQLLAEIEQG
ncbi:MAG: dephospho-CoA kinase [Solirubrobacterales bacterium]